MTFLELRAFIQNLPPESATQTVLRDRYTDQQLADMSVKSTGHGVWSKEHMLLAQVYDAIQTLTHVQLMRGGVKTDPPEQMARPGVVSRRQKNTSEQAIAYLESIRRKHEQAQAEEAT